MAARQVWLSDNGGLYENEREALLADVAHWRMMYETLLAERNDRLRDDVNGSIVVADSAGPDTTVTNAD